MPPIYQRAKCGDACGSEKLLARARGGLPQRKIACGSVGVVKITQVSSFIWELNNLQMIQLLFLH